MRKKEQALDDVRKIENDGGPRSYPAPWNGQLLLACAKCQKKLRRAEADHPLGKLTKVIKRWAREDEGRFRLRVIRTPCLKLCPKGGVAACTQDQLGRAECSILRSSRDVGELYNQAKAAWSATRPR